MNDILNVYTADPWCWPPKVCLSLLLKMGFGSLAIASLFLVVVGHVNTFFNLLMTLLDISDFLNPTKIFTHISSQACGKTLKKVTFPHAQSVYEIKALHLNPPVPSTLCQSPMIVVNQSRWIS